MKFVKWLIYPTWAQVEYTDGNILRGPRDISKDANYQQLLAEFPKPATPKVKRHSVE